MRFYVGTTFSRYEEARTVIDALTSMGHACVEDWTRAEKDFDPDGSLYPTSGDGYQEMVHWPEAAQREVDAIGTVAAEEGFCLFLGEQPSLGWPTEFGMSIAFGVPHVLLVAPFKTTVFVALPQVTVYENVRAALEAVEAIDIGELVYSCSGCGATRTLSELSPDNVCLGGCLV